MKKAIWFAIVLAGLCATIPFSTALAQGERKTRLRRKRPPLPPHPDSP